MAVSPQIFGNIFRPSGSIEVLQSFHTGTLIPQPPPLTPPPSPPKPHPILGITLKQMGIIELIDKATILHSSTDFEAQNRNYQLKFGSK